MLCCSSGLSVLRVHGKLVLLNVDVKVGCTYAAHMFGAVHACMYITNTCIIILICTVTLRTRARTCANNDTHKATWRSTQRAYAMHTAHTYTHTHTHADKVFYPICINYRVRSWRANDPMNQYQYHMSKTTTTKTVGIHTHKHITYVYRFDSPRVHYLLVAETTSGRRIQSHNICTSPVCVMWLCMFFLTRFLSLPIAVPRRLCVICHTHTHTETAKPYRHIFHRSTSSSISRRALTRVRLKAAAARRTKNRKHCARTQYDISV